MKKGFIAIIALLGALQGMSQLNYLSSKVFTRQDTLRGTITPERVWWDLTYYHLDIAVDIENKFIKGSNSVHYRVIRPGNKMQIDLQTPLAITKVEQNGKVLEVEKDGNAHFIWLENDQPKNSLHSIKIYYEGNPRKAVRAPWDGGVSWKTDKNGNPFVATSCQGLGASIWWPCKDHMYDEPDSMLMSINVPKKLVNVSNGRLRSIEKKKNGTKTYHWFVSNPINNYGVNINIGDYVHWDEKYKGEKGTLNLAYYVLRDNLNKAKEQFKQVPLTLQAFEHWFGPYPFYEDGYKLVEVPYLGMEHQSSITYGNGYKNGYRGTDLSDSGYGLLFDFIIVHESGHEWFANNITYKDIADMWIHEGFTAYSECLFVEYHHGKEAGAAYVTGTRRMIENDRPVIGKYDVNFEGSADMYYKGSNMLHTLRQWVNDDELWRQTLRKMNQVFYHQTVTTQDIENFMASEFMLKLDTFFDQYLRTTQIPVLEYYIKEGKLFYRWQQVVQGFNMPIEVSAGNNILQLFPGSTWRNTELTSGTNEIVVNKDYYVYQSRIK